MLVDYLLRQPNRMFPPILVVVEEPWVGKPDAPEWVEGEDGEERAGRSSLRFSSLDSEGRVGLADLHGVSIFVIDGSHRWMGISGLMELIAKGHLQLRKKDGASTGPVINMDELAEEHHIDPASIPAMEHETMGIELIPAVMKGETREEARRRIRSVFVHVNKSAEPPSVVTRK